LLHHAQARTDRASSFVAWRKDIAAGAIASIVSLPVCIASGVLAFAPLGPDFAAAGAAAGLTGAIVTGIVVGLVATSSFIIASPRVSESLLLASLIVMLSKRLDIANDKALIVIAVFSCALLGGLFQAIFGLAGVAKIIKFTPHPVLVGFLNGIAVLVAVSQLKPYFLINPASSNVALIDKPSMFLLMVGVAILMLSFPMVAKRFPARWALSKTPPVLVGFIGGIGAFYFIKALDPGLDLGPIVGEVNFANPVRILDNVEAWKTLVRHAWDILPMSAILAVVATMDSLLAFRAAQNVSDLNLSPVRDLFAQGLGNSISALAGGTTSAASPSPTMAAYRAGGRNWPVPITSALILLALGVLFPKYLAKIPSVVLSGILLAVGISLFDRWVIQVVSHVRNATTSLDRRRSVYDLVVVLIVMGITVFYSVIAGVIVGCVLAGIIFVMNMSRPIVRRILTGSEIQSKRLRPAKDVEILRDTGSNRAVLQLEGVLFFGNADDLSARIKSLFQTADMITLDMRGVNDVDVSGANILANLVNKSRELKKILLFCHIPPACLRTIESLIPKKATVEELIKPDLDSSLEWMEEKSLLMNADKRSRADVLSLEEMEFLAGIEQQDLDRLSQRLMRRDFTQGETICQEGDAGDRMWLLAKGSVSVRLRLRSGSESIRIASLARGTIIGEMSLIDSARRSATIVADEAVVCYELLRNDFDAMLSNQPEIATKLLSNLARELSRRLRLTSQDLRGRN
jgi:MFS superfamily sulfate permease-like transporter